MGMATGGSGTTMSEINVTPLVDVMLVLLIIFMVATPLIERERRLKAFEENRDQQQRLIELNLPLLDKKDNPADPPPDSARVQLKINASLGLLINDSPIGDCSKRSGAVYPCLDAIAEALAATPAQDTGVTIDASARVPFGLVVGAIHALRQAGIEKVGMMPHEL